MREKASKLFEDRSLAVIASALLLVGGGTAAIATVVSAQVTGDVTVDRGIKFEVTGASGTLQDSQSFTASSAQGSEFSFDVVKENQANDETQDLVEVVVLDVESEDADYQTLDRVNFQATQQTPESEGSTVPEGRSVDFTVDVAQDGTVDESENGDYLFIGNAETDDDEFTEVVACVANPAGDGQGMTFGPNETWEGGYTFDTQSTFPDGDLTVTSYLAAAVNPTTGDLSEEAQYCPQYSS